MQAPSVHVFNNPQLFSEMATSRARDIGQKAQTLPQGYYLKDEVSDRLNIFLATSMNDRLLFAAAGFLCINLSLLCAYLRVTPVTTYIVVLIQFEFNWLLSLRSALR
jgi:hypothetical protein